MQTSLWPGEPTLTLPDYRQPLGMLPEDPPDTQVLRFVRRIPASSCARSVGR